MNLKFVGVIAVAILGVLASSGADASTLIFSGDSQGTSPYTTFADGTFSTNLSGDHPDGFYHFGPPTNALNGFGQSGEKIFFTSPVELNSLTLSNVPMTLPVGGTDPLSPTTITVLTFDSSNNQLSSQTVSPFGKLTFNEMGVSTVEFDFTGGTDAYGDGRLVAWYIVSDVTYSASDVSGTVPAIPEPSTWAMLLIGFVGIGFAAYRRRRPSYGVPQ
jgi:hypothetical protein